MNKEAQSLGKLSWLSRSKGKTKQERSKMMIELAKKSSEKRRNNRIQKESSVNG